jgi:glycosyltransferase domain-containing protein
MSSDWIKKPLILFGTGQYAIELLICLKKHKVNIIAISDNNPDKWGTMFCGIEVISPKEIKQLSEDYYILIASSYIKEIYNDLVYNIKVDPYRIKCMDIYAYSRVCKGKDFYRYNMMDFVIDGKLHDDNIFYENGVLNVKNLILDDNRWNINIKRISVLISTRNTDYLKRNLDYFIKALSNQLILKIYVLDASTDEYYNHNSKLISSYEAEIEHFRYDYNSLIKGRLISTLKYITDEYIVYCADDDFVYDKAIVEAIDILDKEPDTIAVIGNLYTFEKLDNISFSSVSRENWDLDDPIERINSNAKLSIFETHYSVYRKEIFESIVNQVCLNEYDIIHDLTFYFLAPLYGKIKKVNMPMNIRELNYKSAGALMNKRYALNALVLDGKFEDGYEYFRKCIFSRLYELSYTNELENNRLVSSLFSELLKFIYGYIVGEDYFELQDDLIDMEKAKRGISLATEILCIKGNNN